MPTTISLPIPETAEARAERIVYKYPLDMEERQIIPMPIGAQVLCAQIQRGTICLWALVNPHTRETYNRVFLIEDTGNSFTFPIRTYIGTVQMGQYVWHVFEEGV